MTITLSILDQHGETRARASGETSVFLCHDLSYQDGDLVLLQSDQKGVFLELCLDNSLSSARLFLPEGRFAFPIPSEQQKEAYPPFAFKGNQHRLMARLEPESARKNHRNLAVNPYDRGDNEEAFPHVTANVETRGEAAFAARNVIDGEIANTNHGFWPYTSWGINCDPNAALTLNFGRMVCVKQIVIFTRADFPHDAWWQSARITLSDGWSTTMSLKKQSEGQLIEIEPHFTTSVHLDQLVKAEDPSPFPALSQLEVWGCDDITC